MSSLSVLCEIAPTEVDAALRTAFDFRDVCAVRLQAEVVAPGSSGAVLDVRYTLDAGATWTPLSAGGTGPKVSIATAGSVQGSLLNVATPAAADVILSVFVRGGDGTTVATLGNLNLFALVAATPAGACPEYGEGSICPLSGTYTEGLDFQAEGFSTLTEFTNGLSYAKLFQYWAGDYDNSSRQYVEESLGASCIVSRHGLGGTPQNLYWWTEFNDTRDARAAMMLTALDYSLTLQTGDLDTTDQGGLRLFTWYGVPGDTVKIQLQDGRVWASYGGTYVDIGDAALVADGAPKKLICQVIYQQTIPAFDDQVAISLFVDEPCDTGDPTYFGGHTFTVSGAVTDFSLLVCMEHIDAEETGDSRLWQFAHGEDSLAFVYNPP